MKFYYEVFFTNKKQFELHMINKKFIEENLKIKEQRAKETPTNSSINYQQIKSMK